MNGRERSAISRRTLSEITPVAATFLRLCPLVKNAPALWPFRDALETGAYLKNASCKPPSTVMT